MMTMTMNIITTILFTIPATTIIPLESPAPTDLEGDGGGAVDARAATDGLEPRYTWVRAPQPCHTSLYTAD